MPEERSDLVLMDIRMPVMDGVVGTRRIKALYPQVRVVILTTFRDEEHKRGPEKRGRGLYSQSQPADSIVESLRAVGKGNIVLERDVASSLSAMLRDGGKPSAPGMP